MVSQDPVSAATARRLRTVILAIGGVSLLTGLNAGLLRLGLWAPLPADRLADLHGPLMVLGFLGTVIALERAQALRHPLALLAPALLGSGSALLVFGGPHFLGKMLISEGAAGFVIMMVMLWRRTRADLVAAQVLGALVLLIGTVMWFWSDVAGLLPVLVAFLVVTIAAERAELAQLSMGARAVPRLVVLTAALSMTSVAAVLWPEWGSRLVGALCLFTAVWLVRDDVGRRMLRTTGFRRFNGAALLAGYVWLAVAGLTWVLVGRPESTGSYDLIIHAVFVGFAFSMIMAHAPTIFPAVLGRALPYRPVMWGPLVILHLGMLYRAMGDVAGVEPLWQAGGVVTVVAVLSFLGSSIFSAATAHRNTQQPSERMRS